jgi:hypothetical protein
MNYNPRDHYWFVSGDEMRVYSSKRGAYVTLDDAEYTAWLGSGGVVSRIASEDELGEVLAPHHMRPAVEGVLNGYLTAQAREVVSSPSFKPTFLALVELANIKGETEPTAETAVAWIKENAL